jgi:hypothetical protein
MKKERGTELDTVCYNMKETNVMIKFRLGIRKFIGMRREAENEGVCYVMKKRRRHTLSQCEEK